MVMSKRILDKHLEDSSRIDKGIWNMIMALVRAEEIHIAFPQGWQRLQEPLLWHPTGDIREDYENKDFVKKLLSYFQMYRNALTSEKGSPKVNVLRELLDGALERTQCLL